MVSIETLLVIAGGIVTIGGAMGVIRKYIIQPINQINEKFKTIDEMHKGQKMLMKAQATTMEHIITGNHIDKMKEEYENLINYCIEK